MQLQTATAAHKAEHEDMKEQLEEMREQNVSLQQQLDALMASVEAQNYTVSYSERLQGPSSESKGLGGEEEAADESGWGDMDLGDEIRGDGEVPLSLVAYPCLCILAVMISLSVDLCFF